MHRRSALVALTASAIALSTGIAGLVWGFLGNALRRRSASPWIWVGPLDSLPSGTFQRVVVSAERRHAWMNRTVPLAVFVKDRRPREPLAILSTCSHLGCSVSWDRDRDHFLCPCHDGVFDAEGKVLEGPPPRPLTHLATRVDGDALYVRLPEGGVGP